MPAKTWQPTAGQPAYLTPRTIGVTGAAFAQPRVVVLTIDKGMAEATVELPDGMTVTTHVSNLRATAPTPPKPKSRLIGHQAHRIAPEHGVEITLFDL